MFPHATISSRANPLPNPNNNNNNNNNPLTHSSSSSSSSSSSRTSSSSARRRLPFLLLLLFVTLSHLTSLIASTSAAEQVDDDDLNRFSLTKAADDVVFVQEQPSNANGVVLGQTLKLMWRLDFGSFTKDDFVYTLHHKYERVKGGEGMTHVSQEYPTECAADVAWGPAQCGSRNTNFEGRVIMYITTMTEAGYDALIVNIKNVTLADFNVDPDREEGDLPAEKMKFEATMHCSVQGHIGERSSDTIQVAYTRVDPNELEKLRNLEKQNVNYATVAIAIVVVVVVILLGIILFAKRKSIKSCLLGKQRSKEEQEVEAVKSNGENEKLAQQQQQQQQHDSDV